MQTPFVQTDGGGQGAHVTQPSHPSGYRSHDPAGHDVRRSHSGTDPPEAAEAEACGASTFESLSAAGPRSLSPR
jgi:hypothetical protein